MTIERAKRLAAQFASGGVCSMREGEAEEYHKMFLEMLLEKKALESNLKALERKTCWISVNDRLPEERGEYLCYLKYEPESSDVIRQNTYYGSGRWMAEPGRLTHWMPLPELPKEGAENG